MVAVMMVVVMVKFVVKWVFEMGWVVEGWFFIVGKSLLVVLYLT